MSSAQILLAAAGALALAALLVTVPCAVLAWRLARRAAADADAAYAQTRTLEARLAELEATPGRPATTTPASEEPGSYLITQMDDAEHPTDTLARIEGRLFADILARESVILAAGLGHGLRRALAPETRNRIRFEMRREVKLSRKQRRAELKAALRDLRARQRAALRDEGDAA